MDYPWYQLLENDTTLNQGDFIPSCPIFIPPRLIKEGIETEIDVQIINSIVLTQSCDLVNGKSEIVLVCPYYSLSTFLDNLPKDRTKGKGTRKIIDSLRKGDLPSYHLLDKDDQFLEFEDYKVVDFKNVYGIQFDSLIDIVAEMSERIRLLPPYREHLSQAFARYFMRVGLPQDINVEGY